jgi:hypothetical protein
MQSEAIKSAMLKPIVQHVKEDDVPKVLNRRIFLQKWFSGNPKLPLFGHEGSFFVDRNDHKFSL